MFSPPRRQSGARRTTVKRPTTAAKRANNRTGAAQYPRHQSSSGFVWSQTFTHRIESTFVVVFAVGTSRRFRNNPALLSRRRYFYISFRFSRRLPLQLPPPHHSRVCRPSVTTVPSTSVPSVLRSRKIDERK